MNRRWFNGTLACSLVVFPLAVEAQHAARIRRIGWLGNQRGLTAAELQDYTGPLRNYGWIEGQNLAIEQRHANGNAALLAAAAEELVRIKVELIVAEGTIAALAAKNATKLIPVVFVRSADPVRAGLVTNLARPDANVTGTSTLALDLDSKRLEILRELLPMVQRVGELQVPTNPIARIARAERQGGLLPPVGIELIYVDALQAGDLESAIAEAARRGAQALHVRPEPLFAQNFHQIVLEAQRHELPILADNDEFLDGGALVSYGPDNEDLDRLLAYYIDKILRGAKPADLPIQQPRKFDLGINRKVAKSLGIRIPQSILLRAGKVVD